MTLRTVAPFRLGRAVLHSRRVLRTRRRALRCAQISSDLIGCQRAGGEGLRPNAAGSSIRAVPSWLSALLGNPTLTALAGVIVGAVGSYIAGAAVARTQRMKAHKAAVRAVLHELTQNATKLSNPAAPGLLSSTTYDGLLVPLYGDLPDVVAHNVSLAYGLLHMTGPDAAILNAQQQAIIRREVPAAQRILGDYAERSLGVRFPT
jgi:hypothetical protein